MYDVRIKNYAGLELLFTSAVFTFQVGKAQMRHILLKASMKDTEAELSSETSKDLIQSYET